MKSCTSEHGPLDEEFELNVHGLFDVVHYKLSNTIKYILNICIDLSK